MSLAFIFPGQAAQYVGMANDLYATSPIAKEVFDLAEDIAGTGLKSACFEGPEETLKQTIVTQPAVFAHSVATFLILKDLGIRPNYVAGHSVGELAALVAAGAISVEDGLRLVRVRATEMHAAGQLRAGTMAAILGLDSDGVSDSCKVGQEVGTVVPANYNCPGQIVISGEVDAVRRTMEIAQEKGAKRAIELQVSGAFHSELMRPAQEPLRIALDAISFSPPKVPVVPNVTAVPCLDPVELKNLLVEQVVSPVKWTDGMTHLVEAGMNRALEIGPSNTLKILMRRIARGVEVTTVDKLSDLERFSN